MDEKKGLTGVVRCDVDSVTFRTGETCARLSLTPADLGREDPETFLVQVPLEFGQQVARWIEGSAPGDDDDGLDLVVTVTIALEGLALAKEEG